ncbi:DUF4222 domain-containing protein, partial [Salmonella enterica subsp. enterica]|nr:DUF4222 domain-containing protein [Salmonella enterica subsp. enterica serovar Infantis]
MFQLIQRGQIYADQHGWPVIIHSCTSQIVRYWRQGRINTASIERFNSDFEPLDHHEAAQIPFHVAFIALMQYHRTC